MADNTAFMDMGDNLKCMEDSDDPVYCILLRLRSVLEDLEGRIESIEDRLDGVGV